jgi:hypothetical protein
MPSSNGSLIIPIKPKPTYKFHAAFILLFYILHKITYFSKIYYHASYQDPRLNGALTSRVHAPAMLLLSIVGN